jgi:hypothetical protein
MISVAATAPVSWAKLADPREQQSNVEAAEEAESRSIDAALFGPCFDGAVG